MVVAPVRDLNSDRLSVCSPLHDSTSFGNPCRLSPTFLAFPNLRVRDLNSGRLSVCSGVRVLSSDRHSACSPMFNWKTDGSDANVGTCANTHSWTSQQTCSRETGLYTQKRKPMLRPQVSKAAPLIQIVSTSQLLNDANDKKECAHQ